MATIAIFTPIFLGVVIPGRWFIRHRDNRQVRAFVRGATAAAAGAIGGVVLLTRDAVSDYKTAAIAVVALVLLYQRGSADSERGHRVGGLHLVGS